MGTAKIDIWKSIHWRKSTYHELHLKSHNLFWRLWNQHIKCSKIIQVYSDIFRTLCNCGIFRILVYAKSETKTYSEPCQTSVMEHFTKIVNSYSCFCKLYLQYQLFKLSTFFNKSIFLLQKYLFVISKSIVAPRGLGVMSFDIVMLC